MSRLEKLVSMQLADLLEETLECHGERARERRPQDGRETVTPAHSPDNISGRQKSIVPVRQGATRRRVTRRWPRRHTVRRRAR